MSREGAQDEKILKEVRLGLRRRGKILKEVTLGLWRRGRLYRQFGLAAVGSYAAKAVCTGKKICPHTANDVETFFRIDKYISYNELWN